MKLSKTVGGLFVPPTKRVKFNSLWVDLIHSSPANQTFRERTSRYKDVENIEALLTNRDNYREEDGSITEQLLNIVFDCWIHDWGGWDENGKACPLYDDEGEEVPCTIENFTEVVNEHEGGEHLFYEIMNIAQKDAWFRAAQSEEEKNFLRPSQRPSSKATNPPTRKGRKPGPRSNRSKQPNDKQTPSESSSTPN